MRTPNRQANSRRPENRLGAALPNLGIETACVGRARVEVSNRGLEPRQDLGHRPNSFLRLVAIHLVTKLNGESAAPKPEGPNIDFVVVDPLKFRGQIGHDRAAVPAARLIRETVRRTNGAVPVYDVQTMEERTGVKLGIRRVLAFLLALFGGISLGTTGMYGVIAQVVAERTQ